MTDLEKIELAIRKVASEASDTGFAYWFAKLADQIANDEMHRAHAELAKYERGEK